MTCVCVCCLTVRFGGDPQGGRALSWPHIVVSNDPETVTLLWFKVGHCQLQRLRLRNIYWPLPDTGKHNVIFICYEIVYCEHKNSDLFHNRTDNLSCNLCNPITTAANPKIAAPLRPLASQLITRSLERQLLMAAQRHLIHNMAFF